jgi:hypothetical protein
MKGVELEWLKQLKEVIPHYNAERIENNSHQVQLSLPTSHKSPTCQLGSTRFGR